MVLSSKIRIYPNSTTRSRLNAIFRLTDYIYNKCITMLDVDGKIPDPKKFLKSITKSNLTGEENLSFKMISLSSQLLVVKKAYTNYIKAKNLGKQCRLKRGSENIKSFKISEVSSLRIIDNKYIDIPYVGTVRTRYLRELKGKNVSILVKQEAGNVYYLVVNKNVEKNDLKINKPPRKSPIGIDLGINYLITTSDGKQYPCDKNYTKHKEKLSYLKKEMSRKVKGSNNYNRRLLQYRKENWKVRNKIDDSLNKLSKRIIRYHSFVSMETFSTKELISNRKKKDMAYMDASITKLINMIKYKANLYDRAFVQVDKYFPSSQICSNCGYRESKLKDISIKHWKCENCGCEHDRDINAAKNILKKGKLLYLIAKKWKEGKL